MANTFTAEVRLTHRYIDRYSHLDSWGKSFTFKALGAQLIEGGNGYDCTGTQRFTVIGDKNADQEAQARAIASHFGYHGCTHEHDCCGCHSTSASVTKKVPGRFSVLLTGSRNY